MAQNDLRCRGGSMLLKTKSGCLHSLALVEAHVCKHGGRSAPELASWLRRHKVGKAVMEASGGYEQEWAKALRDAKIEVRIVDPKASSQLRSIGRSARQGMTRSMPR